MLFFMEILVITVIAIAKIISGTSAATSTAVLKLLFAFVSFIFDTPPLVFLIPYQKTL